MNVKIYRCLFLVGCVGLLAYGVRWERHPIHSLGDGAAKPISGPAFVQGATVDNYMRQDSRLYDIYSLSKVSAGQKDCKT